jgi:putative ABC transport system permease protein
MNVKDTMSESYGALTVNKVRTGLTMLGIIIGIGSVIALVAIGQGSQASIQSNIQSLGANLILITPGAPRGVGTQVSAGLGSATDLTSADEAAVASAVTTATAVEPELSKREQVTAVGTNTNTTVIGTSQDYPTVRNETIDTGSWFTAQQVTTSAKVAVIGPTVLTTLFPTGTSASVIGQIIKIGSQEFTVVGVTVAKGGSGFVNQDDEIFIPISTMQHYIVGLNASGQAYVSTIAISAQTAADMTPIQNQVTALLLARHNISDPTQADFTVQNQADIVATASSVTGTFTILLASVAGISLLVGGIGIMNMMLTTVTERTREIGLRKAIGATRTDINTQFLIEAVMLTFLGGAIGTVGGWLAAYLATKFGGIATSVSWSSVLLAFGVSAVIGVLFGYYPARRASRLNPIEALRFE